MRTTAAEAARAVLGNLPAAGNVTLHWAKVSATHAGPPKTVDVYIDGATTLTTGLRYLSFYSPSVNDIVPLLRVGSDYLILGTLA